MRVSILGMHYSPEPSGNAPYTTGLAEGLAARGHDVRVVTGIPHYPEWAIYEGYGTWLADAVEQGVQVRRLRHYVPRQPTSPKRLLMELTFGARAAAHSRWGEPDVVLAVSPALFSSAMAISRLKRPSRRPAIGLWVQDLYSVGLVETGAADGGIARGVAFLESHVARAADGVAVIHDRFRRSVIEDLRVPEEQVRVIRNWTHLESVDYSDRYLTRKELGWREDEVVALHAGNMGVKQGLENVVEAARYADARALPIRFVLLGGGNQRARLEEMAEGVRRIEFVSSLPDAQFQGALSAADVLVVNERPGLAEMSVPSKLTSYFSSGRPVVAATEAVSVTAGEIAASGAGECVAPGVAHELAEAVLRLGRDTMRSTLLGEAGLAYAYQALSRDTAIDHFEQWLMHLIKQREER